MLRSLLGKSTGFDRSLWFLLCKIHRLEVAVTLLEVCMYVRQQKMTQK